MVLKRLEKTSALRILNYLHTVESANRTMLRENVDAAMETIYSALNNLENLGLIEEDVDHSFPKTITVHLTKKGTKTAKQVHRLKQILEDKE